MEHNYLELKQEFKSLHEQKNIINDRMNLLNVKRDKISKAIENKIQYKYKALSCNVFLFDEGVEVFLLFEKGRLNNGIKFNYPERTFLLVNPEHEVSGELLSTYNDMLTEIRTILVMDNIIKA